MVEMSSRLVVRLAVGEEVVELEAELVVDGDAGILGASEHTVEGG